MRHLTECAHTHTHSLTQSANIKASYFLYVFRFLFAVEVKVLWFLKPIKQKKLVHISSGPTDQPTSKTDQAPVNGAHLNTKSLSTVPIRAGHIGHISFWFASLPFFRRLLSPHVQLLLVLLFLLFACT